MVSNSTVYMIERPARRERTRPALARMLSRLDKVLWGTLSVRAISPAASPSAPDLTSSRNTERRPCCASAERALLAESMSICRII